MKILVSSHSFHPAIGGLETASRLFAEEFAKAGHDVTVITQTPPSVTQSDVYAYKVVRQPSNSQLTALGRGTDIHFQNNISLKTLLPLLLLRKPTFITHQTWLHQSDGRVAPQDRLKRILLRFAHNISISKAIADSIPVRSILIGNPYESHAFAQYRETPKTKDIVFMGRLVSDKGGDLILQALSLLKNEGLTPTLTFIGDGTQRQNLEALTVQLGLTNQVTFLGNLTHERGLEVARHKIMVIPSRWAEPFGIVALEGLAAGCVLAASNLGGLPEAVGPCGELFPNGDAPALAAALKRLLTDESLRTKLLAQSTAHLENFNPTVVAKQYLNFFQNPKNR
ncbi:glycosyltransferase family 4 protein [Acidicapsa ligni]|uniref:glycosyltransferase family 4 protein n=1 Tax=Acidicapsa ligni TaxID=542300 RepID=UPI0021E07292|nr:glycosyltransferase family 4 protein [Acidicapsa ligni]